jgi:hypothetical protein
MVVTEAAKKKKRTNYQSKAKKSNVRASLLTEFQAAIAYACYDSPSLLCGATSMTDAQQYNIIADLFLGNSEMNPDSLCYVDQFLHGLNKFHGLFTTSSVDFATWSSIRRPATTDAANTASNIEPTGTCGEHFCGKGIN